MNAATTTEAICMRIDRKAEFVMRADNRFAQKWSVRHMRCDPTSQEALFAGYTMNVDCHGAHGYQLEYFGHVLPGFDTLDDAKVAAPVFAREVLTRLAGMIFDCSAKIE